MIPSVLLLLGFVLLFFGGELLVRSSVALALRMRISTLVVGMTVVSFATSAPELFVSLQAVFEGSGSIALGNAIGSNIANIALVLGFTAIIFRVNISNKTLTLNYPMMLASSVLLGLVLYFFNGIPVFFGVIFVLLLIVFVFLLIRFSRKEELNHEVNEDKLYKSAYNSVLKSVLILILGIVLLKYGADFLVDSAKILAESMQISEQVIAVTVVAIGTSVPELATSIVAALKREDNLAVGNLIGSNIFNILAVLGVTSCVEAIKITNFSDFFFDYFVMFFITLVLGLFIYMFSKRQISRKEGFVFVFLYFIYLYWTVMGVI